MDSQEKTIKKIKATKKKKHKQKDLRNALEKITNKISRGH